MEKMNFCEVCAQKKGINDPSGFALTELLLGLGLTQDTTPTAELSCSVCELTQTQFKKTGRLGCSACYDLFIEELIPMLRNMHPSLVHVGKAPRHFVQEQKEKESIQLLQKQLQKAIAEEEYENAAQLRDKILALQDVASTTASVGHSRDREVQKIFPFEVTAGESSMKVSPSSEISE